MVLHILQNYKSGGFFDLRNTVHSFIHALIHFNVVYSRKAEIEFKITKVKRSRYQ